MPGLDALTDDTINWLDGKKSGGPLGPNYDKNTEVKLGTRLNELSQIGIFQKECTGATSSFTLSLGSDYAGAKTVGSIADLGGTALTVTEVTDADADGNVSIELSGNPGVNTVVVSVMADARA